MKIIPVIDVLNGIAVHGKRGERKHYQPLKSLLCNSPDPTEIASAFETLGFSSLYLADLDAILGKSANFSVYEQIITKTRLDLMVDAGTSDLTQAEKALETGISKIVIGSETLHSLDFVQQAVGAFGEEKIVVSIDQKEGKLLSGSKSIGSMDVISFAQQIVGFGVRQIILLDLGRVGTEHGTNLTLMKTILETTGVNVVVGGGIKSLQELETLRNLGVYGALVATVLHNGNVTIERLKDAGFLQMLAQK